MKAIKIIIEIVIAIVLFFYPIGWEIYILPDPEIIDIPFCAISMMSAFIFTIIVLRHFDIWFDSHLKEKEKEP